VELKINEIAFLLIKARNYNYSCFFVENLLGFSYGSCIKVLEINQRMTSDVSYKTLLIPNWKFQTGAYLTVASFLHLRFVWSLSDIIIGMIMVFHLFPLLFIAFKNREKMCKGLDDLK
jgi:hypothetical protein